jgi:hypothetical protein
MEDDEQQPEVEKAIFAEEATAENLDLEDIGADELPI